MESPVLAGEAHHWCEWNSGGRRRLAARLRGLPVIVSVVDVRIVLMEVCQENMGVDMAVPQINGFCAVVFVNVMLVMLMGVRMDQLCMGVFVPVLLSDLQPDSHAH